MNTARSFQLLVAVLVILGLSCSAAAQQSPLDFSRDVRPILADACFKCHGPDEGTREADLRLDQQESATADRGGYAAVVPGKAGDSDLIKRILSDDPELKMPPPDSGKNLTPAKIETLKQWINEGGQWSEHWAFTAPVRPEVPSFTNAEHAKWTSNPIDAFVLARLQLEGLAPSDPADKVTLLRRLSLDLIGLPPTIEEVDEFLADSSDDAYAKQVERFLRSEHYGERWGRHWLDAARYADSDGYEKDKSRQVWAYRDWVIGALNRDLPYNQFIVEQIAGDLLPSPSQDQIVATGFLRNSMINEEGGIDPEQFRMEAMYDRMDAIGKGILGITIQCSQCHNHKFDPVTQEEYYKLFAFINNAHEANIAVYTSEQQVKRNELVLQIRELETQLKNNHSNRQQLQQQWEDKVRNDQPEWHDLQPSVDDISTGGQKYLPLEDGSFLAQGYAPTKHRVKMTIKTDVQNITAFRLELLNDPNLPLGGPGRSIKGTAALTEFEVEAAPASAADQPTRIKFVRATSDCELPEKPLDAIYNDKTDKKRVTGPIAYAIDGVNETAWGTDAGPGRSNQPRKAVFQPEAPITHEGGTILTFYLVQNHGGWNSDDNQNHNLGRFRLSIAAASDAVADPLPAQVRHIISKPLEARTAAEESAVFSYFRTTVADWKETNDAIEALWQQHPEGSSQLVLQQRDQQRMTHILDRGDFLKPLNPVEPGVPAWLHPLPEDSTPDRLAFAQWLVDPKSPTTARSIVNRVWQHYFGIGIVSTSEDLGSQSEAPSHRELLDWLAVDFMERGWKLKDLHRLIVNSNTYRQSSRVIPELFERDPYNRLLARGARLRVEGEIVRDIALATSGLLNKTVGGPSVFPPAPSFLFEPPASYGPKNWYGATDASRYRRALYTFRFRSVPYPVLQNFDSPNGDFSCVRRARSNTPLQALTSLNEPLFVECAQALAKRVLAEGGEDNRQRLEYAFRLCVARVPTREEQDELYGLLQRQTKRSELGETNAHEIAGIAADQTDLPAGASAAEVAGWTAVARVLLNVDETITRE